MISKKMVMACVTVLILSTINMGIAKEKKSSSPAGVGSFAVEQLNLTINTISRNPCSDDLPNLNTATIAQLVTVEGVGESKAQAIIDDILLNGEFPDCFSVSGVPGISSETALRLCSAFSVKPVE